MKQESEYYRKIMKKYSTRDASEWIIGVVLCLLSIPFISTNIFMCGALALVGVALLSYCAGKDSVTMRMMKEELDLQEAERNQLNQQKMW